MYISDFGTVRYRSLWTSSGGATIAPAIAHWHAWINRSKVQHEIDLSRTGRHQLNDHTWVVVAHQATDQGRAAAFAAITFAPQAMRVTSSTAVQEQGGRHWLQTVLHHTNPGQNKAFPPGFETRLRDELEATDGTHPLRTVTTSAPSPHEVAEALTDPDRLLPAILITPPNGATHDLWADLHQETFRQIQGMGALFSLDTPAQQAVSQVLPHLRLHPGRALVVPPLPELEHTGEQIPCVRLSEHLVAQIRQHAVQAQPPMPVRSLMQQAHELLSELAPQRHATETDSETDPQRLERLTAELHHTKEALTRARSFEPDLVQLRAERDHALGALEQARSENSWLREQAALQGLHQLAGARAPLQVRSSPAPERVPDLLEAMTDTAALAYLHLTLDERRVRDLAHDGQERLWVTLAWEALGALNDWARYHHEHPGNGLSLHEYLKHAPSGYRTIPAGRWSASESATVRRSKKLSAQRLFPVPPEVDPSGKAPMYAHIRLDTNSGCPRLHFLSDMARERPRIIVGYIGPHLQVSTSN